eukprot:5936930-Prymnesium_polylepis.1
MPKPPPTCLDFECTLEEMFRGCVKHISFRRVEFKGSRHERRGASASFAIKVNRGELEGAAFWHKGQGHTTVYGKSDLVYVLKQAPHALFERLGEDLWYQHDRPVRAEALVFCARVPTLDERSVLATGNTLGACLGFDRSGLGTAIVAGFGMPARDASDGWGTAARGDLVVKFPIELPAARRRVQVVGDGLLFPPLLLLTSEAAGGLRMRAVDALVRNTLLPHALLRLGRHWQSTFLDAATASFDGTTNAAASAAAASAAAAAAAAVRSALVGVCLVLSPGSQPAPGTSARGFVSAVSAALPELVWREIHMSPGLAEPLLPDEEAAIECAAVLLLVAEPDRPFAAPPPPPPPPPPPAPRQAPPAQPESARRGAVGAGAANAGSEEEEEE